MQNDQRVDWLTACQLIPNRVQKMKLEQTVEVSTIKAKCLHVYH